jgi:transcriptional regulator with XRE-family HTH domain
MRSARGRLAVIQQFGTKLRRLRQQRGLTLRELAAALGYAGTGYLSDIEFGKKYPTADLILKASRFFGVSMDQLAKDEIDLDTRDAMPDDTANSDEPS